MINLDNLREDNFFKNHFEIIYFNKFVILKEEKSWKNLKDLCNEK